MTAVVIVNVVLPGLVPLLMHKSESVRVRVVNLISFLSNLVGAAKDTRSWPEFVPSSAALVGSTRRKNLFMGSLVEVQAAKKVTDSKAKADDDEEDDAGETEDWGGWKAEQAPAVSGPRAELFAGLELKKSPVVSRASEAPLKTQDTAKTLPTLASSSSRGQRSKSEEAVVLPVAAVEPKKKEEKSEPAVFVVPSPRGHRPDVAAKIPVVLPPPISPPNQRVSFKTRMFLDS